MHSAIVESIPLRMILPRQHHKPDDDPDTKWTNDRSAQLREQATDLRDQAKELREQAKKLEEQAASDFDQPEIHRLETEAEEKEAEGDDLDAEAAGHNKIAEKFIKTQKKRNHWKRMACGVDVFRNARRSAQWIQRLLPTAQMSGLIDKDRKGELYSDGPGMARILRNQFWGPGATDENKGSRIQVKGLQQTIGRRLSHKSQVLRPGESKKLIKNLPQPRASDVDNISNGLLKLAAEVVTLYLESLFNACLLFAYEPQRFKLTNTIVLQKINRDSYTLPKNWRPIALLPTLGKFLTIL